MVVQLGGAMHCTFVEAERLGSFLAEELTKYFL
jgi:hypothetical protein